MIVIAEVIEVIVEVIEVIIFVIIDIGEEQTSASFSCSRAVDTGTNDSSSRGDAETRREMMRNVFLRALRASA